ncbi:MAG: hypothetical protein FD170_350 [Bacteroidetes bacterium]|nr:MAG: hypothetical protein FD170_350 [Bacteroidota bacterium]
MSFRTTAISLFCGMMMMLAANVKANPDGLTAMDKNIQQMISFYAADTIIVVLPDGYSIIKSDEDEIRNFVFWKQKPAYIFKQESELTPSDLQKHLHFFGPCFGFTNSFDSEIPFAINAHGFSFNGTDYQNPEDAFYFMNTAGNRLYTCRNGENFPLSYARCMAGAYQLYIFSGSKMVLPDVPEEMEQRIASRVWFHIGRMTSVAQN